MLFPTGPNGTNPDTLGVPGFNEFYYLLHNEEARAAVKSGEFESGLEHYLARGQWDKFINKCELIYPQPIIPIALS